MQTDIKHTKKNHDLLVLIRLFFCLKRKTCDAAQRMTFVVKSVRLDEEKPPPVHRPVSAVKEHVSSYVVDIYPTEGSEKSLVFRLSQKHVDELT